MNRSGLLLTLVAATGCAQIKTTSRVEVTPRPGVPVPKIGSEHGQVTARGADFEWAQRSSQIEVVVFETRRCRKLELEPVLRVEYVERKAGQAVYWEYGIAAAFLGVGLTALIAPQLFGPTVTQADGTQRPDTTTGYRLGGVFTGLGAVALAAGVVDTVRARDQTYFADAYRVQMGEQVECAAPRSPLSSTPVRLIIEDWSDQGVTDREGRVRFDLPAQFEPAVVATKIDRLPGEVEAPSTPAQRLQGVIAIDDARTVAFDFVVPYASAGAAEHRGSRSIAPDDLPPPPRPTENQP